MITVGGSEKRGVNSPALLADWAILDADLTLGLPRGVTAATGIDAMVHAIEAYTSARLKNPMSDLLAREALRLLAANLLRVCDQPGRPRRARPRCCSAPISPASPSPTRRSPACMRWPIRSAAISTCRTALSNALMLTHVLGHNMHAAMPLYAELGADPRSGARAGSASRARRRASSRRSPACRATRACRSACREVGVGAEHLDLLAAEAMKQERLLINNPCPISQADARRLYEAAL